MLNRIQLTNFKASRNLNVRLAPLTVLAGLNGSGKSSLLQAVGAIRQSYDVAGVSHGLVLGGELVQLGQGSDVLNEDASDDKISVEISENDLSYTWVCTAETERNHLLFTAMPDEPPAFIGVGKFQFLQADRIVPATLYPQATPFASAAGFLGVRGEFTADFLATNQGLEVSPHRYFKREGLGLSEELFGKVAPTTRLSDQVAGWLQQLSPGVRFSATRVKGTDEVSLQFSYVGKTRERESGSQFRPTNVGFGLTYSLPIITACLSSTEGSLLLIENPEAHIHPQGQVALGELLARCANDGVQIIVETHSDHVLNGICLAVKNIERVRSESIALHFFSRDVATGEVAVTSPAVLEGGQLSNWPEGFFDQWDKSVNALLS